MLILMKNHGQVAPDVKHLIHNNQQLSGGKKPHHFIAPLAPAGCNILPIYSHHSSVAIMLGVAELLLGPVIG